MTPTRKHEIGVGVLMLASVAALAWMSLKVGDLGALGRSTLTVTARLPDAAGVGVGAEVKVAGVEVGRVESLHVEHDAAVLTLALREDAGLRQDAKVQVRARSVLGEKYLALLPQSEAAPLLIDGGALTDSLPQTEIDQLVNALGPLVEGVDGEGLNDALAVLTRDPARLERMVAHADTSLEALASASAELPTLVRESRSAVAELRQLGAAARATVDRADRLVRSAQPAVDAAGPAVDEARALAADSRVAVGEARGVLADLRSTTGELDRVLQNFGEIDKWELRRLLREEGILIRLRESEVEAPADGGSAP